MLLDGCLVKSFPFVTDIHAFIFIANCWAHCWSIIFVTFIYFIARCWRVWANVHMWSKYSLLWVAWYWRRQNTARSCKHTICFCNVCLCQLLDVVRHCSIMWAYFFIFFIFCLSEKTSDASTNEIPARHSTTQSTVIVTTSSQSNNNSIFNNSIEIRNNVAVSQNNKTNKMIWCIAELFSKSVNNFLRFVAKSIWSSRQAQASRYCFRTTIYQQ